MALRLGRRLAAASALLPECARAGTVDGVFRMALRPRWLIRHVLALLAVFVLVLLGRWQWDVSQSSRGGLQELLYAFQWWAIGCAVIYGWWRLLRDDTYGRPEPGTTPASAPAVAARALTPTLVDEDDEAWARRDASTAQRIEEQLAAIDGADSEPDEELAEYNRYLAQLNRRSERTR